ncbi:hypothetical protein ZWY2020_013277 [Hordeum vulgare]|nr:hypothetical protein ZWY2020_013277 [Hordeum vulgare]
MAARARGRSPKPHLPVSPTPATARRRAEAAASPSRRRPDLHGPPPQALVAPGPASPAQQRPRPPYSCLSPKGAGSGQIRSGEPSPASASRRPRRDLSAPLPWRSPPPALASSGRERLASRVDRPNEGLPRPSAVLGRPSDAAHLGRPTPSSSFPLRGPGSHSASSRPASAQCLPKPARHQSCTELGPSGPR